ncbi:hypothetical protein KIM372_04020 [Bombiscardovia nodaiensis]|uniref:ribonuclease H n=1 Tax=Bombiscardovia nodaiensis TaxID=2932181 RepID=A0ABM8B733_9BIFI|nr:hypothetical protein KIM372_04020 [Bombiscardovia nodaiensis]
MSQNEIVVSTDGSALGNPNGPMGWAWADHGSSACDAGGATNGTNQIGELCAVLQALRTHKSATPLTIQTDSQYAINCSTKWVHGWKKKGWKNAAGQPVKNRELIEAIDREISSRPGPVKFFWVKGHAGDEYNEKVDDLAHGYASAVRRGDKRSYLPLEGWRSLLASPYTKGLKISEEVRLQLKGQQIDPAQADELYQRQSPEQDASDQGTPGPAAGQASSPARHESQAASPAPAQSESREDADDLSETQVLPPVSTDSPEETQVMKPLLSPDQMEDEGPGEQTVVLSPLSQSQDSPLSQQVEDQEPDADEPAEVPTEEPTQASAETSTAESAATSPSRGLTAHGDLTITPPPSASSYFAGQDLHISGSITFEADIDQAGHVHINAPFRLHAIEVQDSNDSQG